MKQINRLRVARGFVLALMVVSMPLQAAIEAGKILYSRGVVSIVDGQDSARGGNTGAIIHEGDRVVTGRGALAQIRLSDDTLIALRGNSDYRIDKQNYDEQAGLYEQAGQLFTGWMRSITGAIGKKYPNNVTQRTSVATIGIRGTVYQVIHIPPEGLPGYAGEEPGTYVFVEEGAVEVTGESGKRWLQPGEIVFMATAGGAPRLVPLKKALFLNPDAAAVRLSRIRELEFSKRLKIALNDTLADFLAPDRPLERAIALGFTDQSAIAGGSKYQVLSFNTTGSGPARFLTSMALTVEGTAVHVATGGVQSLGFYQFANGNEINWGVWTADNYKIFHNVDGVTNPQSDWHYMMASNVLGLAGVSALGLTGSVTYNFVGGTFAGINGGAITADFASSLMNISIDAGALGILTEQSTNTFSDFYGPGIAIGDVLTNSSGSISGAFVADGAGIVSSMLVTDGVGGSHEGTAAFAADGSLSAATGPAL